MNDSMNARIRAAAGRVDPMQVADEALAARAAVGDLAAMREQVCAQAGLSPAAAGALRGADKVELEAFAAALAAAIPAPPEPSLNDRIRIAAGRESVATGDAEPLPATSFDGGARTSTEPDRTPSMNSLLRGERDQRREEVAARADAYETG